MQQQQQQLTYVNDTDRMSALSMSRYRFRTAGQEQKRSQIDRSIYTTPSL